MPNNQPFKYKDTKRGPASVVVDDWDFQITAIPADVADDKNAKVDIRFYQVEPDGTKTVVGAFRLSMRELEQFDKQLHRKSEDFHSN